MQHAKLSSVATAVDIATPAPQEGRIAHIDSRSARMEMVMRELAKLQAEAARLAAAVEADGEVAHEASSAGEPRTDSFIRGILQARLDRKSFFPGELFSDPAWDMLLDLYAAELGQVRVSVSSLCIASNTPSSTALRWISALERQKLIERQPDPLDGRRFFLSLTREAVERFERYFSALGSRAVI